MNVDTPLIHRLRAHLLGLSRHSIPPQHGATAASESSPEEAAVIERFRPFAELFYLVATADGHVDTQERAVMVGAFRALTGGRVRGNTLEALHRELQTLVENQGTESRLEAVCAHLAADREEAELAFTLASAVALADHDFDASEQSLLKQLASWLGISASRIRLLVEQGQKSIQPSSSQCS